MKSALIWLDALLHIPRLLRRWWYVRKLPASQLQELMALQEGQEGREGPERLMILDVRSREEFTGELGHLDGAVLLPLPELGSRLDELIPHRMQTIVTV
jgi:3-mercaptopyruvate sulfurtransferase SseA